MMGECVKSTDQVLHQKPDTCTPHDYADRVNGHKADPTSKRQIATLLPLRRGSTHPAPEELLHYVVDHEVDARTTGIETQWPSRYPIRRGILAIWSTTGFGLRPRSSAVSLSIIARLTMAAPQERNGCGGNRCGAGLTIGSLAVSVSRPKTRSARTCPARCVGATPLPV